MGSEGTDLLGVTLRDARESAELSYREVHAMTGLALSHLQRLERGEVTRPAPETLRRLASALGVSYEGLLHAAGYL